MKTRHIIAIGLLSALAVGLLGFAISKTNKKPKTLQTNATFEVGYLQKPNIPENEYNQLNFYVEGESLHNYSDYVLNERFLVNYFYINVNFEYINNNYREHITVISDTTYYSDNTGEYYLTQNIQEHEIIIQGYRKITGFSITNYDLYVNEGTIRTRYTVDINYIEQNQTHLIGTIFEFTKTIPLTARNVNLIDTYCIGENNQQIYQTINTINYYTNQQTSTAYTNGYNQGLEDAETSNYQEIYNTGYTEGHTTGYNEGVAFGYDASALENPVDFAPMMLNILTMPFTFISQAFDVTLWPNTQYQINIGNFIKALLAISAILFIIRLFTTGFSIIGNYSANVQNHKLTKQKIAESKAKTNLINRTDPNHKTSHKTSVNHNYTHKE